MSKRQKTKNWLSKHKNDPYVKQAQKDGYRSRACYKLIEILDKHKLCKDGQHILELGSAPGGWTQVMCQRFTSIKMTAVDILPMDSVPGAEFIQGDCRDHVVHRKLSPVAPFDLLLSDMAPNKSGFVVVDQYQALELWEMSLVMAEDFLKPDGSMVIKVFHGRGFEEFFKLFKTKFQKVYSVKPKASRSHSNELYLVGKGFTLVDVPEERVER